MGSIHAIFRWWITTYLWFIATQNWDPHRTASTFDRKFWQKFNDKFFQLVRIRHVSLTFGMLLKLLYYKHFSNQNHNMFLCRLVLCAFCIYIWYKSDTSPWRMLWLSSIFNSRGFLKYHDLDSPSIQKLLPNVIIIQNHFFWHRFIRHLELVCLVLLYSNWLHFRFPAFSFPLERVTS